MHVWVCGEGSVCVREGGATDIHSGTTKCVLHEVRTLLHLLQSGHSTKFYLNSI